LRHRRIAVLRGGALEPEPCTRFGKLHAKADTNHARVFRLRVKESFSLRRGLDSVLCLLQAGHHLWLALEFFASETTEGDHNGSPSTGWICG
jgi:hypothetical protein